MGFSPGPSFAAELFPRALCLSCNRGGEIFPLLDLLYPLIIAIFRKAVTVARERGDDSRGPKIGSEDVNRAAGEHEGSKREELKRDAIDDQRDIEEQFEEIVTFCTEQAKANLFLLDKRASGKEVELIQELVDLRLIHFVSSRITVSKEPGKIFEAYMLDVSQYTGSRARRNFEIVNFWKTGAANLRRVKLIYTPSRSKLA